MNSVYDGYDWPQAEKDMLLRPFLGCVQQKSRNRVLDLGCGTGWITAELAPYADYLLGIDHDDYMIQEATKRKLPNVDFQQLDADNIASVQQHFDLTISTLTMQMLGPQNRLEKILQGIDTDELITLVPHPAAIDKVEEYSRYAFPDNFNYHRGGEYNVWLDNGKSTTNFQSRHMPLKDYFYAFKNAGFTIENLNELGGTRKPYFLLLEATRTSS